ncbi:TIGR03668 family PPOX class F420-dependent oxidoreductase [Streptomyces sp. NPDC050803]|uniref:TIGR03668 family PPOX class F420-dependent oxidoreductase n=1 Tax=unclassified Streptomyces TaxID=2593676 RepID=UPI0034355655
MPGMDPAEARRRFADARVARLATVDPDGRPHLVPLVFAVHGDRIVTAVDDKPKRSRRLTRLRNIAGCPAVCLLADAYDEDWDRLWWVRVDGDAHLLAPGADQEFAEAIALLRRKYPQYRDRPPEGPVVVVTGLRWTGWRAS